HLTTPHHIYTLSLHDALPISWEVNGVTGGNSTYGTISSTGLYTPPPTVPSPATVTVTVISQENTADLANASVTIVSGVSVSVSRSEEHTSELQSRENLVCRLL